MSLILLGILNSQAAAAGGAGAYDLLETVESSASTVTFTGLGSYSDYKHLQLRFVIRGTSSNYRMRMRLNGATTNYIGHELLGTGTTVTSFSYSLNGINEFNMVGDTYSDSSSNYGAGITDILDFSNTSKNTTIRSLYGRYGSEKGIALHSGLWDSTSAVTSLSLVAVTTGMQGRYSLYGVR